MEEFIKNFAAQWDETEMSELTPDCVFHDLEEWSSLTGLAILNMINKKYGVKIFSGRRSPAENNCEMDNLGPDGYSFFGN